jgi:hypothetical protein
MITENHTVDSVRRAINDTIADLRPSANPFQGGKMPESTLKLLEAHLSRLLELEQRLLSQELRDEARSEPLV